ncbi:MAG: PxKF domain-containing protein, partial [Anaerolineales bacterium]|nr:PxKF domain-containing protein [Anaerolineales bacterium]
WINQPLSSLTRLAGIAAAPEILAVAGQADLTGGFGPSTATFSATLQSDQASGVQAVWVTWTDPAAGSPNTWQSFDLTPLNAERTLWGAGNVPIPGSAVFMVQAVGGGGLVSLDTNNGAFYPIAPLTPPPPPPVTPAATTLTFQAAPASGAYGRPAAFSALLTAAGQPVVNQLVVLAVGAQQAYGTTNANGLAAFTVLLSQPPGGYAVRATFAGAAGLAPASVGAAFAIVKDTPSLSLTPAGPITMPYQTNPGIVATLRDGAGRPLAEKSVTFVAAKSGVNTVLGSFRTDLAGRAALGTINLPAGTYLLTAYFSGQIPGAGTFTDDLYHPATAALTLTVTQAPPPAAVVTWTPAPLLVGARLGPAQLNATANVPGTFKYTPPAGTLLGPVYKDPLTRTLTVVFTPTDPTLARVTKQVKLSVLYKPAGTLCLGQPGHAVLPPFKTTTLSIFRQGRTVPIKFRVCDVNGNSVGVPGVVAGFGRVKDGVLLSGEINEPDDDSHEDTYFRWDSRNKQWVFNLRTKDLRRGRVYTYRITLNDGTAIDVVFGLK